MKIGISCHALKESGGIERYAMDLVRGLHRRAIKPVYFAKKFDTALPHFGWVEACKIGVRWLPQKLRDPYFSWRLQKEKRAMGVDTLISCNRVSSSDIAICGGTHLGFLRAMGRRIKWTDRIQIYLEKQQYASARAIVAHSQLMVEELHNDYQIPPEKITLIYPPVDTERFQITSGEQRRALRQQFEFPPGVIVFLFASSSHERKGFPLLAEFFSTTKLPVMLAVVGRPISISSPKIRYLGFRKDIEACYQAADFTILASHYEPFGLVGIESVLCGTPVVMAEQIGCLEVISNVASLRFDAHDDASLATAVGAAVARATAGSVHLSDPMQHLSVDIGIDAHVAAVLALCESAA